MKKSSVVYTPDQAVKLVEVKNKKIQNFKELNKKTSFFKYWLRYMVLNLLPANAHRKILLGSVVGLVYSKHPDVPPPLLNKINQVNHLARNEKALELPIYLYRWLWNDNIAEELIKVDDDVYMSLRYVLDKHLDDYILRKFAEYLYTKAPDYIIYADKDTVIEEIFNILKCINDHELLVNEE